jgi:hypothetical protein
MARKSVKSLAEENPSRPAATPKIHLTLTQGQQGQLVVGVSISEFIAYSQNVGFTRLNLTGGKVLEVKESTDQIDRLVRAASSQPNALAHEPVPGFDQAFSTAADEEAGEIRNIELQGEFPGMTQLSGESFNSFIREAP